MDDEETILRKMRRLTDHYDIHKEIGRWAISKATFEIPYLDAV